MQFTLKVKVYRVKMGFRLSMGTYLRKAGLQTLQMILALAYVLCQLLVTWLQF